MIDRCFWPSSVEAIMDNLRRESHPFAKEILERMEANSMLSMSLSLAMLRRARNMCFGDILRMEANVALNKMQDGDFALGMREVLQKPSNHGKHIKRENPGFSKQVTEEQLESYFAPNPLAARIDLDIVEKSLLPTRHFHDKFTDSLRVFINETNTNNVDTRDAIGIEIKEQMRALGIDFRNKTLTIPQARDYVYKHVQMARHEEE